MPNNSQFTEQQLQSLRRYDVSRWKRLSDMFSGLAIAGAMATLAFVFKEGQNMTIAAAGLTLFGIVGKAIVNNIQNDIHRTPNYIPSGRAVSRLRQAMR